MKITKQTDSRVKRDSHRGAYGRYIARRSWRENAIEYVFQRKPTGKQWVFVWDCEWNCEA